MRHAVVKICGGVEVMPFSPFTLLVERTHMPTEGFGGEGTDNSGGGGGGGWRSYCRRWSAGIRMRRRRGVGGMGGIEQMGCAAVASI